MYPVSEHFLPALTGAHGIATQVDIMYGGAVVAANIPITDGKVTVDASSDVRRSLSLTVPDPSVFPGAETDPYAVYGQQLFVRRGIRYVDGTTELIPLGFFVITDIGGDIHLGPLTIEAAGLEYLVKAQPFEGNTSTGSATSPAAFIEDQLEQTVPSYDFVDESTDGTTGLAFTQWDSGSDRWAALQDVARSVGCELYADANGTFRLRDMPQTDFTNAQAVWDISAGANGVLIQADVTLSAEDVYNKVVVRGENTGEGVAPVTYTVWNSDPADPLRLGGPFGRRTKVYSSDLVTEWTQAGVVARSLLRAYRAPNRTVTITTVPNAALDAGDVIRVGYGRGRDPELFIVRRFDISLSADGGACVIETVQGRGELEEL